MSSKSPKSLKLIKHVDTETQYIWTHDDAQVITTRWAGGWKFEVFVAPKEGEIYSVVRVEGEANTKANANRVAVSALKYMGVL